MSYHYPQPSGGSYPPQDGSYDPYHDPYPRRERPQPPLPLDSDDMMRPYRDEPVDHSQPPSRLERSSSHLMNAGHERGASSGEKAFATGANYPTARVPPARSGQTDADFRTWRRDFHGNLWTKGRGVNCFARFCCCSFLITVFLIVSIILTIAVYVRPPDITFNGITLNTDSGGAVQLVPNGLTINLNVNITVANPNFFSAGFKAITATAFYPITGRTDTKIGGGERDNVVFRTDTVTELAFPLAIQYTTAVDPDFAILKDILTKCGLLPGTSATNLNIHYTLQLAIKIVVFTIRPSFTGDANFQCPISAEEANLLVGQLNIPGLSSIVGGGGGGN